MSGENDEDIEYTFTLPLATSTTDGIMPRSIFESLANLENVKANIYVRQAQGITVGNNIQ
jgi:hypothetical protein